MVLVFKPGDLIDKNTVVNWGSANGVTESLMPRALLGTYQKTSPVLLLKCTCTPPFSPDNPYVVFLQAKQNITVTSVVPGP